MKNVPSVNRAAWRLLEKLVENQDFYRVKVTKTSKGTMVVDAGVETEGGFHAGSLITEICMGGLAEAHIVLEKYDELTLASIFVCTDHPVIATLGSQYAGWQINENGCFVIGSGPARALALKPKEICREIGYKDECDRAVVVLESEKSPPERLLNRIIKDCRVEPKRLGVIVTPTTSIAGNTQVAGRIIETGIHKLRRLGFDTLKVTHALGQAPIPPAHPKFVTSMARTNDAILYGGTSYYVVDCDEEEKLIDIVKKVPSSASEAYGKPFREIFKEAQYDFYKIDPDLFAPAVVVVNNAKTGHTFRSGKINAQMLKESFDIQSN